MDGEGWASGIRRWGSCFSQAVATWSGWIVPPKKNGAAVRGGWSPGGLVAARPRARLSPVPATRLLLRLQSSPPTVRGHPGEWLQTDVLRFGPLNVTVTPVGCAPRRTETLLLSRGTSRGPLPPGLGARLHTSQGDVPQPSSPVSSAATPTHLRVALQSLVMSPLQIFSGYFRVTVPQCSCSLQFGSGRR